MANRPGFFIKDFSLFQSPAYLLFLPIIVKVLTFLFRLDTPLPNNLKSPSENDNICENSYT